MLLRHSAADGAGTIGIGNRSPNDVDRFHQFGIDIERRLRAMVETLEILSRAIHDDGDAAEILQSANVDRGGDPA